MNTVPIAGLDAKPTAPAEARFMLAGVADSADLGAGGATGASDGSGARNGSANGARSHGGANGTSTGGCTAGLGALLLGLVLASGGCSVAARGGSPGGTALGTPADLHGAAASIAAAGSAGSAGMQDAQASAIPAAAAERATGAPPSLPPTSASVSAPAMQEAPGLPADPPAAPQRRVMVTLAPAPGPIWDQISLDLQRTYRLRTVFAWSMQSLGERCIVFEAPPDRPIESLLRRLAADPRIELAQPVQRYSTQDGHTTTALPGSVPLQHSAQVLGLTQAHRWATGKGVRVAVIDTGVDVDHPELRGRIAKVADFVGPSGAMAAVSATGGVGAGGAAGARAAAFTKDIHGTAVAGVIVAAMNAEIGLVGVAPQAELFALKACWQERPGAREAVCDSYTLAKAIDYAIGQGAQVINFSLAGPPDPLLAKLVAAALARGIVVVAAAGPDAARSFPASEPGVLAVAGSDDLRGGLRFPTRRMAAGTLAAPGVDILTTVPNNHYDFFSGSSFAAAQVSGVVALLLEREPRLAPARLAALVHRTAHPIQAVIGDPSVSVDQVDACAALAAGHGGIAGGCH